MHVNYKSLKQLNSSIAAGLDIFSTLETKMEIRCGSLLGLDTSWSHCDSPTRHTDDDFAPWSRQTHFKVCCSLSHDKTQGHTKQLGY